MRDCEPFTVAEVLTMPVYVYKCDACGLAFERKQAVCERSLTDCPECEGRVRRVIQPVGIAFKGSGFYVTDHRSHNATTDASSSKESASDSASKAKDSPGDASSKAQDDGSGSSGKAKDTSSDSSGKARDSAK